MNHIKPQHIGVIADDFTGAIDAGIEFVRAGFSTTFMIAPQHAPDAEVEVVSTDSRDGDALTARGRAATAAMQMRGRHVFKKIDSTMRGHIGEEIVAMLGALGQTKAVVCPSVIEAGRTVRAGQLWVHDMLLHASDFARDPRWPARTADLGELLGVPSTPIPLATVRAGVDTLAAAIIDAPTAVVVVDACDQADLELVSRAALMSDGVPCGALGLARAWARCHSSTSAISALTSEARNGPILVVAGSRHPRTSAQVQRLLTRTTICAVEAHLEPGALRMNAAVDRVVAALSADTPTVICAPRGDIIHPDIQRALLTSLGELTLRACEVVRPGALVLTGGETASAVSRLLGATSVRILGELEVGVPWGRIVGGVADGCLVVTKAGGFGEELTLLKAVDALFACVICG